MAGGSDVDFVGLEVVEGFKHQPEGFAAGRDIVGQCNFEDGHGAAREDHVVAQGADAGRKELMEMAHFVEHVAEQGAEDALLEHGEEFRIRQHGGIP